MPKSAENLVSRLDLNQKAALREIFKKLNENKKLSGADVGLLGLDMRHCPQKFILELFNITAPTLKKWEEDECPRSKDGSYNATYVYEWRLKQEKRKYKKLEDGPDDKDLLSNQKLKLQCEKLEMEIEEQKKNSIQIVDHNRILGECFREFKNAFTEYGKMNLHFVENQPIEKLREYWNEIVKQGLNGLAKAIK